MDIPEKLIPFEIALMESLPTAPASVRLPVDGYWVVDIRLNTDGVVSCILRLDGGIERSFAIDCDRTLPFAEDAVRIQYELNRQVAQAIYEILRGREEGVPKLVGDWESQPQWDEFQEMKKLKEKAPEAPRVIRVTEYSELRIYPHPATPAVQAVPKDGAQWNAKRYLQLDVPDLEGDPVNFSVRRAGREGLAVALSIYGNPYATVIYVKNIKDAETNSQLVIDQVCRWVAHEREFGGSTMPELLIPYASAEYQARHAEWLARQQAPRDTALNAAVDALVEAVTKTARESGQGDRKTESAGDSLFQKKELQTESDVVHAVVAEATERAELALKKGPVKWDERRDQMDAHNEKYGRRRDYYVKFEDSDAWLEVATWLVADPCIVIRLRIYCNQELVGDQRYTMVGNVDSSGRNQRDRMNIWVAGQVFAAWQANPTPKFQLPLMIADIADPSGIRRREIMH